MRNNSISIIVAFLLIIVLVGVLAGCTQRVTQETTVDDPAGSTGTNVQPTQIQKEAVAPSVNTAGAANPEVIKLFARQSMVKSFSFDVAKMSDSDSTVLGNYFVRGDLVKIVPTSKNYLIQNYNVIYLDMDTHRTIAYCTKSGCVDKNKEIPLQYDDWVVPMPLDWASDIQYGKVVGTVTFYNKQVTRVQYQKGALYYEAYVDNYFGYPMRVVVSSDSSFKNIVSGYEYRSFGFNTVEESDVIHVDIK